MFQILIKFTDTRGRCRVVAGGFISLLNFKAIKSVQFSSVREVLAYKMQIALEAAVAVVAVGQTVNLVCELRVCVVATDAVANCPILVCIQPSGSVK